MADALFTQEQREYFESINSDRLSDEVAKMLNEKFGTTITAAQIIAYRKNHKLPCGKLMQFGHGQKNSFAYIPHKGRHHSPGTEFKKGIIPHNTDAIGTQKWIEGYLWEKIDNQYKPENKRVNWIQVHHKVWIEANGPIPKGMRIIFRDGDRSHIEVDNLMMVSQAELQYINAKGLLGAGPEYSETAKLTARLYQAMKK